MTLPPEPHAHRESPVDRFAGLKLAILIGCCGALVIAAGVGPGFGLPRRAHCSVAAVRSASGWMADGTR